MAEEVTYTPQSLTDEIKRLRRVNEQQAAGWKSCVDQLRDAQKEIEVLRDDILELVAERDALEKEVEKYEDA